MAAKTADILAKVTQHSVSVAAMSTVLVAGGQSVGWAVGVIRGLKEQNTFDLESRAGAFAAHEERVADRWHQACLRVQQTRMKQAQAQARYKWYG